MMARVWQPRSPAQWFRRTAQGTRVRQQTECRVPTLPCPFLNLRQPGRRAAAGWGYSWTPSTDAVIRTRACSPRSSATRACSRTSSPVMGGSVRRPDVSRPSPLESPAEAPSAAVRAMAMGVFLLGLPTP
ncbi:hypothetical protein VTO73DRAFT_5565 [Trametes versicolor]